MTEVSVVDDAIHALATMPIQDFLKSPHALNIWIQRDGYWSRGNPGRVPYQVRKESPEFGFFLADKRYWNHYGFQPEQLTN